MEETILLLSIIVGLVLIFAGIILMLMSLSSGGEREKSVGGVVIIGPIPIVFGSTQRIALIMLVLAIILTILLIISYLYTMHRAGWLW